MPIKVVYEQTLASVAHTSMDDEGVARNRGRPEPDSDGPKHFEVEHPCRRAKNRDIGRQHGDLAILAGIPRRGVGYQMFLYCSVQENMILCKVTEDETYGDNQDIPDQADPIAVTGSVGCKYASSPRPYQEASAGSSSRFRRKMPCSHVAMGRTA